MNLNEENVDWNDLKLFLAVAREGSLSAAAVITKRSPATLGRRMYALEKAISRELFYRHDRGYELIADGLALFEELSKIEPSIINMIMPSKNTSKPVVKISAGTWTSFFLIQNLSTLTGSPPDVYLRFLTTEKVLDISHREIAVGFRNKRPTEESFACRKLARIEFSAYATQSAPRQWIKVLANTPSANWLDRNVGNDIACETNIPRNSLDLALQSLGEVLLPTFIGDNQPLLERRGKIIQELSHDQWLVIHQEDRYLPEVRRFINRLDKIQGLSQL